MDELNFQHTQTPQASTALFVLWSLYFNLVWRRSNALFLPNRANGEMKHDGSDEDSEEENEEGDYTVYECPGLAPVSFLSCLRVANPV